MLIYYIITVFSMLLMLFTEKVQKRKYHPMLGSYSINNRKKGYLYIVPFIPLFLLSSLRYGIGTDYFHTYYPTFYRIKNGIYVDVGFEPAFFYLNKIIALFSEDVTWVLATCALIFFIFAGLSIIQQSDDPVFSLGLLFGIGLFSYSLNGVRQSIVIAVWLFSLRFVREKRLFPFIVCIIASCFFHASAIILIPFYFVFQKKVNPLVCVSAVLSTIVFSNLIKKIILYFAGFTKYLDKFNGSHLLEGNFAYSEFLVSFGILLYLLLLYKILYKSWKYNFLLISTTIACVCAVITHNMYIIARISVFFRFVPLLYLPSTLQAFKGKRNRRIVMFVLLIAYFLSIGFMIGYIGSGD